MIKLFLILASLIMFGFFIFLVLDISGILQINSKASKAYQLVKKYSSWILGFCAIILYLLMKRGVLIANLLLIPYLFFLVMMFLNMSVQTDINIAEHIIIITSIFSPFVFILFPYLLLKVIVLAGFILLSGRNIYQYINLYKKPHCFYPIIYSLPIFLFLIIAILI